MFTKIKENMENVKYRYVIQGPISAQYVIEESTWNDKIKKLENEDIHVSDSACVKNLLGFCPSTLGKSSIIVWFSMPKFSLQNKDTPFIAANVSNNEVLCEILKNYRYIPSSAEMTITEQAEELIKKFKK